METAVDKFLDILPTPILVAVGLVCVCAWIIREAGRHKSIGAVLALRSFQTFCAIILLPVGAYYAYSYYAYLFPSPEFKSGENGIAVASIERDAEGVVQALIYESMQVKLNASPDLSGAKVKRFWGAPKNPDEAMAACWQIRATVCVWGNFIPPTTVYLHAAHTSDPTKVMSLQIKDYAQPEPFLEQVIRLISAHALATIAGTAPAPDRKGQAVIHEERQREILDRLATLEQTVSGLVAPPATKDAALAERQRRRLGLFVGISEYQDMPRLRFPASDAKAMSDTVGRLWPKTKLHTILDREATERSIRLAMDAVQREVTSEDQVWIYLAGHAVTASGQSYFLPADAEVGQPFVNGLPFSELREWLMRLPAKQVVVFLDTCYSGSLLNKLPFGMSELRLPLKIGRGTVLFVATGANQVAWEDAGLGHGVFTNAVLEGLNGRASGVGGFVTHEGLSAYVRARVADYNINGVEQHPGVYSTVMDGSVLLAPPLIDALR
ncbi:caspase family protein [Rhizobium laguerreae]